MASVVNKLWNMIGMNTDNAEEDYDYNEEYDEEVEEVEDEQPRGLFGRKNKVTTMQPQARVVVMQPTGFEQSEEICNLLREKKSIIVNFEYVNKDTARRVIDVVSGAAQVLDGRMQKISNSIFLIAPYNYSIESDIKEDSKSKLPGSWLKGNVNI